MAKKIPSPFQPPRRLALAFALVVVAFSVAAALRSGRSWVWLPYNSAYTTTALKGLTYEEVVTRLGPAYFDSRTATTRPGWDESRQGLMYLGYTGALGANCTIIFKDGRVAEVYHSSK